MDKRDHEVHLNVNETYLVRMGDELYLVKKPVRNLKTAPNTMAGCSNAINEPRTSGWLISAR